MFLSQGHAKAFYFADPAEGNQRRAEGDGGESFPGQTVSNRRSHCQVRRVHYN